MRVPRAAAVLAAAQSPSIEPDGRPRRVAPPHLLPRRPPTQGPDRGTIGARSCALAFFGASPNLSAAVVHPSEKNDEDHTGCAASVRAPVHPPAHRAGAGRGAGDARRTRLHVTGRAD